MTSYSDELIHFLQTRGTLLPRQQTHFYWIVRNDQGEFKLPSGRGMIPDLSEDAVFVDMDDGSIRWKIRIPEGVLIKYPCGTKRFISASW